MQRNYAAKLTAFYRLVVGLFTDCYRLYYAAKLTAFSCRKVYTFFMRQNYTFFHAAKCICFSCGKIIRYPLIFHRKSK